MMADADVARWLGANHGCWTTFSTDDEVRKNAASGGTTSQLLINLLEQRAIDGALVWRMELGAPKPAAKPFIARDRAEVLGAQGSKYCAVDFPRDGMPLIRAFEGRLAVVLLPCDASFLRRKIRKEPQLAERIACVIVLFCGHNSTPELTARAAEKLGFSWPDVRVFRHRSGAWRGRMTVGDGQRTLTVPTSRFTHYQNLFFYSQRKCLTCADHFGYDGDICVGDVWSRRAKRGGQKPSAIVVKTAVGRDLWESSQRDIAATPIDAQCVLDGNARGVVFHYNVSARSRVGRFFGLRFKDRQRLPVTTLELATAFVCVFNHWLSSDRGFEPVVAKLPMSLIRPYVYMFKGLQQLMVYSPRPTTQNRTIAIVGATLSGNRGAEAMLVTTIGKIREFLPDARFVVLSYYPTADSRLCEDPHVEIVDATPLALVTRFFPAAVADRATRLLGLRLPRTGIPRGPRELRESCVLLDLSGVSYCDGREKFLPFNLLNNWPAMLFGVPVVKLSQAMGSFKSPLVKHAARFTLRRCERVFARGRSTYAMCKELGIKGNLGMATDVVFLLKADYALRQAQASLLDRLLEQARALERQKGIVAIVVSSVVHQKAEKRGMNYPSTIATACRHLLGKGWAVILLPNAVRADSEQLHNNDLPVLRLVRDALDAVEAPNIERSGAGSDHKGLMIVDEDVYSTDLHALIGCADAVVASRFHAMIGALSWGRPVMVIGWGHKYKEVLSEFESEDWAIDESELVPQLLCDRMDAFLEERERIAERIGANVERVKRESQEQFDWLQRFMRQRSRVGGF